MGRIKIGDDKRTLKTCVNHRQPRIKICVTAVLFVSVQLRCYLYLCNCGAICICVTAVLFVSVQLRCYLYLCNSGAICICATAVLFVSWRTRLIALLKTLVLCWFSVANVYKSTDR